MHSLVPEAGIHVLRVDAEQPGELLDHHLEDEFAQFVLAVGAGRQRPPVHHDPRRPGHRPVPRAWRAHARQAQARQAQAGGARVQPGQGHALRPDAGRVGRRDLLDRELHPGQLGLPAGLQPGHRLQDQLVETLRSASVQGYPGRGQHAAQPASMPVPPPDTGPVISVSALHSCRAYPAWWPAARRPGGAGAPAPGGRIGAPSKTRSCSVPRVVALPPADGYGQPL